ncbi:hypothetical protein K474DRAFT_1662890 [Panus rudis PR-1116 ss-1]|nr:hypothetical protein K474DRAFT_1662890 [Panus rudis PR-1116 ss-1]
MTSHNALDLHLNPETLPCDALPDYDYIYDIDIGKLAAYADCPLPPLHIPPYSSKKSCEPVDTEEPTSLLSLPLEYQSCPESIVAFALFDSLRRASTSAGRHLRVLPSKRRDSHKPLASSPSPPPYTPSATDVQSTASESFQVDLFPIDLTRSPTVTKCRPPPSPPTKTPPVGEGDVLASRGSASESGLPDSQSPPIVIVITPPAPFEPLSSDELPRTQDTPPSGSLGRRLFVQESHYLSPHFSPYARAASSSANVPAVRLGPRPLPVPPTPTLTPTPRERSGRVTQSSFAGAAEPEGVVVERTLHNLGAMLTGCKEVLVRVEDIFSSLSEDEVQTTGLCTELERKITNLQITVYQAPRDLDRVPEEHVGRWWLLRYYNAITSLQRNVDVFLRVATYICSQSRGTYSPSRLESYVDKLRKFVRKFGEFDQHLTRQHQRYNILDKEARLDQLRNSAHAAARQEKKRRRGWKAAQEQNKAQRRELREEIRRSKASSVNAASPFIALDTSSDGSPAQSGSAASRKVVGRRR